MLAELAGWLAQYGPTILVVIVGAVLLMFVLGLVVDAVMLDRGRRGRRRRYHDEPPRLNTRGPDPDPRDPTSGTH